MKPNVTVEFCLQENVESESERENWLEAGGWERSVVISWHPSDTVDGYVLMYVWKKSCCFMVPTSLRAILGHADAVVQSI